MLVHQRVIRNPTGTNKKYEADIRLKLLVPSLAIQPCGLAPLWRFFQRCGWGGSAE